ncbi:MAG: chorismate-binding protein [Flammeovirgaceae bacterium]|nr:chorismate-binding protein [Flammeovirgaceae bacterium]
MKTSLHTEIEEKNEKELVPRLMHYCFEENASFAYWRLPNQQANYFLISFNPVRSSENFEALESGFLFAPFDTEKQPLFLKADFLFHFENNTLAEASGTLEQNSEAWLDQFKSTIARKKWYTHSSDKKENLASFQMLVQDCIERIQAGNFEKIVPSRCKRIPLSENFNPGESFQNLCAAYPNAFVSLVSTPETGTWLGATPELLVTVEDKQTFRTTALAATKTYVAGTELKQVAWTQKEIEEQALVERYIISCFKKIRLREFDEHGPKTMVAGNLMHLRTDFSVDMAATNFPLLGSVMLKLLHPTSAVCGMPLESSLPFLKENEGYQREYYSGYLGPVNIQQDTHLFVNLRCMQVQENEGILYAGAGVTIDSDPEKEYEETEMKMNTLRSVIF